MTELVFILDRSGSMSGLEKDTIGGFNSMLEKQRKEPGDAVVSTVLFDNETEVIHDRVVIADVPNLTDKEFGNGSAMRVSSVAWLYNDIDAVRHAARLSAEVTHNHLEGIKGAEATASAIFLARTGHGKTEIKEYMEYEFGYELNRTCDEIRPGYFHTETCMETVPEAITAFMEGDSFEDVIRTAVSLGGDCDTLTAIAGGIAEGFYGVPVELKEECYKHLPEPLLKVLKAFAEYLERNATVN